MQTINYTDFGTQLLFSFMMIMKEKQTLYFKRMKYCLLTSIVLVANKEFIRLDCVIKLIYNNQVYMRDY